MNKKKGFTLIELLAVIVILAVIALIATPIIMNVINDAKKGAVQESLRGYVAAATYDLIREKKSQDGIIGTYKVSSDGNITVGTKDIVVNSKGSKPTGGAITYLAGGKVGAALKLDGYCVVKYLTSDTIYVLPNKDRCDETISSNLVINGYSEIGNNTNFKRFELLDSGEYKIEQGSYNQYYSDDYIKVKDNTIYELSFDAKTDTIETPFYLGIVSYDYDKKYIHPPMVMYIKNTLTTLDRDLNDGDTEVYFNDISNFVVNETTPDYQLGIVFWNYKDSKGYLYEAETYSRNYYEAIYDYTAVDKVNHKITLKKPWSNGKVAKGTQLSQSSGGGQLYCALAGGKMTSTWKSYQCSSLGKSVSDASVKFFKGTEYVKPLFISKLASTSYYKNIFMQEKTA